MQSGVSRRPIRPICPIRPIGCPLERRRRACGCRGDWKLGSLEVWRLGFLGGAPPHTPTIPPSPFAASPLHALFSVLRGGISRPSPFQSAGRSKNTCPGRDMLLFYCHALGEPMQRFVQTHKGHRTKRRNFRPTVQARARAIACPHRCHWAGILRPRTRHRRRARLFAPCPPSQPPGDRRTSST